MNKETETVIKSPKNKSTGPDGFTSGFILRDKVLPELQRFKCPYSLSSSPKLPGNRNNP